MNDIERAFLEYFNQEKVDNLEIENTNTDVIVDTDVAKEYDISESESKISTVDDLGDLLRKILNIAWGDDWGEITPEFALSDDISASKLPKIVYDINYREAPEKMSKKPTLFGNKREIVDGKPTGDSFNIYRQFYDTVIEFNFFGNTMLEARNLSNKFEEIVATYTGLIKKNGLSELVFLKELPSENSVKFIPGIPMKSLMYYARFEKIHTVRTSLLNKLDYEINIKNG